MRFERSWLNRKICATHGGKVRGIAQLADLRTALREPRAVLRARQRRLAGGRLRRWIVTVRLDAIDQSIAVLIDRLMQIGQFGRGRREMRDERRPASEELG
ncbi:hypothetical protein ADM96_15955 [Burkholderia sp. ST111]|nr:hypothetical protein ADM96_15955 [Burkholderia sp. ST111]